MSTQGIARTRRRTVIISASVLVAVAALSWWAARATTSTAALAHDQKAPTPPVLTAPVVMKQLGTTLQASGKLVAAGSETIDVGSISVPGAESIVTANVVHVGGELHNGSVVAQIAGRPVFVFAGQTPMYRSLASGDTGPDVTQLQHDLERLGYSISDTAGTYGASTSAALATLYHDAGYAPPSSMPTPGGGRKAPRLIVEPQSEIVFLSKLPARVASTKEQLGKSIGSPAVTLTYGSVVVDATLQPAQGYMIEPGDHATVRLGSHPMIGVVRSVKRSMRARAASAKIALHGIATHTHIGSQVMAVIDTGSSAARTLAVPIGALYASGSGSAYVILSGHGHERHLAVNVGQAVGGYVPIVDPPTGLLPGTMLVLDSNQSSYTGFGGP